MSYGKILVCLLAAATFVSAGEVKADSGREITQVSISAPFFNPSLGQTIDVAFNVPLDGRVEMSILDRDSYVVKTIPAVKLKAGQHQLSWDGLDSRGRRVPDEAYSFRIVLHPLIGADLVYFPALVPPHHVHASIRYFDPSTGTLAYELAEPSRVHLQAGVAGRDGEGVASGPVLKTIVNRQPKPAGAVLDVWDGRDESGTIRVNELTGFVMSIAATSLPENSIITVGNRQLAAGTYFLTRTGRPLLDTLPTLGHHSGLTAANDVAPELRIKPLKAFWNDQRRDWRPSSTLLEIELELAGATKEGFSRLPAQIQIFVDGSRRVTMEKAGDVHLVPLQIDDLAEGDHIVAVNWVTPYGPVAVNSFRISISGS